MRVSFLTLILVLSACRGGMVLPADTDRDETAVTETASPPSDPYIQPEVYVSPPDLQPGDLATVHYDGALADRASLSIRYGFNGYNQVEGIDEYLTEEHYRNMDYFLEAEMTAMDGGFQLDIRIPADARAMQFTFFTGEDPDREWDTNADWGYHQSILFPYIGPYLTWNERTPAPSGVVVNFETSVPCLGTVEYGTSEALGERVMGSDISRLHHIALTALEPDTTYHYQVRDSLDHLSAMATFKTASDQAAPFSFIVVADVQDHGDEGRYWSEVAAELATNHADADFILSPGDLTLDNVPGDWWTFFDKARALLSGRVFVPSVGNHDTPTSAQDPDCSVFLAYFDLPPPFGSDGVFRVDYGPAAILAFNSELQSEFASGGAQYLAAQEQMALLQADDDVSWVFAHWHTPPYNAGDRFSASQQATIRDITEPFEGVVDWVFTGHEHLYQRTYPLRYEGQVVADYGTGEGQGVGYVVLPSSAVWESDSVIAPDSAQADLRDWIAYPEIPPGSTRVDSELGFVIVNIDGADFALEAWGMGHEEGVEPAHVVDRLSYRK